MSADGYTRLGLPLSAPDREIYTVARLNFEACALLENTFPSVWVEGELSNLASPSSGHLYFSLKDASAQVRCAMFRNRRQLLRFRPADGAHVLLRGRISLYQPRGDYQLIVEHMEEAGDGALQRAFEELKARLATEGLFDEARKRALPALPQRIGVITSPTGAAVRDVLTVLRRRFAAIPVLIYPVPVQGKQAAAAIARMIRLASARNECDVLILCRGGGSLEDLWSFNEEIVARAIAECDIPIITGIGHEIDFTIADFVADVRAPTPSGAAERVSPDSDDWLRHFERLQARIVALARASTHRRAERLQWLVRRLQQRHPRQQLRQQAQRVDELEQRLLRSWQRGLAHRTMALRERQARLLRHSPQPRLRAAGVQIHSLARRLEQLMRQRLQHLGARLAHRSGELDALSPLATLSRGYAIVSAADSRLVRSAAQVRPGDEVRTRLAEGELLCTVQKVTVQIIDEHEREK
ncbi:MAG: exodeoxyribonuclease VII large subunit [Chromatiales bacterium]|jgi:exodeoxyribonuclease VII large subunit|nr:exodeoxyribonuclease VII large subunit [Chromatiales bacterium]